MEYYTTFMVKLDKNDQSLLILLEEDSKRTVQYLAQRLGLPPTTVHNRIKRLEQLGIIQRYTVSIDWNKAGKALTAYILVSVEYTLPTGGKVQQDDVARELKGLPGVDEVSVLTGGADALVRARVKDIPDLNELVVRKMRTVPGVDKTQTMLVLSTF